MPPEVQQYQLWLKAIDRLNEDGSPWVPDPRKSVVCSDHFVGGKPATDRTDPDYAPSIFETAARKEGRKSESKTKAELEDYDPDDPEFDPFVEPPKKKARGGGRSHIPFHKASLEKPTEKQPAAVKGKGGVAAPLFGADCFTVD